MIAYIFVAICIIILVVYAGQYINRYSTIEETKMIVQWFVLLIIINIVITTFILISYGTIKYKKGPRGPSGNRGPDGSQGRDGSCVMCTPALMGLKPIRPLNKVDRIDPMVPNEEKKLFTINRK